jgi:hypothetical protein
MAHMNIHIEMDNATFDTGMHGELARVLHDLANRLKLGINDVIIIRDLNGNRIGQAEFYDGVQS